MTGALASLAAPGSASPQATSATQDSNREISVSLRIPENLQSDDGVDTSWRW